MRQPMRVLKLLLAVIASSVAGSAATAQTVPVAQGGALKPPAFSVIHAGQLLAVPGKPALAKATVVVENDKVKEIRSGFVDAAALGLPADTPVVDLTNSFVMPGFIDLHVHLSSGAERGRDLSVPRARGVLLAASAFASARTATLMGGFTTVRDLGSTGLHDLRAARCDRATASFTGAAHHRFGRSHQPDQRPCRQSRAAAGDHGRRPRAAASATARTTAARSCVYAIRRGADVIKVMATRRHARRSPTRHRPACSPTPSCRRSRRPLTLSAARSPRTRTRRPASMPASRAGFDSIEHGMWADEQTLKTMKAKALWLVPTVATITFVGDTPEKVQIGSAQGPAAGLDGEGAEARHAAAQARALAHKVGTPSRSAPMRRSCRTGRTRRKWWTTSDAGMTPMEALMSGTVNAAQAAGVADRRAGSSRASPADIVAMAQSPLDDIQAVMDVELRHARWHRVQERRRRAMNRSMSTNRLPQQIACSAPRLQRAPCCSLVHACGGAWRERTDAIEHVTLIDGTGRPPQPDMTVTDRRRRDRGRHAERGCARQRVAASASMARGKFLIPGLMDVHIHLRGGQCRRTSDAAGAGSRCEGIARWRASSTRASPRSTMPAIARS